MHRGWIVFQLAKLLLKGCIVTPLNNNAYTSPVSFNISVCRKKLRKLAVNLGRNAKELFSTCQQLTLKEGEVKEENGMKEACGRSYWRDSGETCVI